MKSRQLIRAIERAGGRLVRTKGDHHIFKLPDGRLLAIPHGGTQNEVSVGMLARARRLTGQRLS